MIQQNELIMLLFGVAVLGYLIKNRIQIYRIRGWKTLISAYFVFLAAWVLTVLEGFLFEKYFNLLEHVCYAGSSILLAVWCWTISFGKEEIE